MIRKYLAVSALAVSNLASVSMAAPPDNTTDTAKSTKKSAKKATTKKASKKTEPVDSHGGEAGEIKKN